MKKLIIQILFLILLFAVPQIKTLAQARRFAFSTSSSAYADLATATSGTTVYGSLVAAASNNTASAVQSLGFNFNYLGTNYTQYSVNSNGLLKFGSIAVTIESVNAMSSTANVPKISGWWDDVSTATSASGGGVIRNLTGVAPNRILKIQWKCASSNLTTSATNMNWQVWLYENGSKIEYHYGSGTASASASIGVGGVLATEFTSITSTASPTSSIVTANDANANWPASGTVYTLAPPAALTGTKTVYGVAGLNQFVSFTEAVNTLNWVGAGSGGVTFNLAGGNTEIMASGVGSVPAGLLITKGGTAANPVIFQWDGTSTKPILQGGTGIGNYDYVVGIAGQDYITLDGLGIQDPVANNTAAKNMEMGIALFKQQYNTTTGNNGCQHVTIKNCAITLTRNPKSYTNIGYAYYPFMSMGVALVHWTSTHAGSNSGVYWTYSNPNEGIKSAADVHSFNTITGNAIDNCTYGISIEDAWYQSGATLYAGTGNTVGQSGAGNTITNFGPLTGVAYFGGGYKFAIAGIAMGGQQDCDIEYNNVSGCYGETVGSNIKMFSGIWVGMGTGAWALPRVSTSLFKINNNTVNNMNLTVGSNGSTATTSSNGKHLYGITFAANDDGGQIAKGGGNIEIKNNTITNLKGVNGNVMAINSNFEDANVTSFTGNYRAGYQSGGDISISNNIINNITRTGINSNGCISAVYWCHGSKNLFINNNQISAFTLGTTAIAATTQTTGMPLIYTYPVFTNVVRTLVQVTGNKISNCSILATPTSTIPVSFTGIYIKRGGINTLVSKDTITGCSLYNGAGNNAIAYTDLIHVAGQPKTGISTVKIDSCVLTANMRTGIRGAANNGYYAKYRGIVADYASGTQVKNISNNIIDGMTQTATLFNTGSYSMMQGIFTTGKTTVGNTVNIYNNTVNNMSGPVATSTQILTNNVNSFYRYGMVGIAAENWNVLNLYSNNVSGLDAGSASTGPASDNDYLCGPTGILAYNNTAAYATTGNIYNNFVSNLTAPAMRSRTAINGLVVSGLAAKYNVFHNTLTLGGLAGTSTGRLASTTAGAFGVTGLMIATYYYNTKAYTTDYRNNIISVNVAPNAAVANSASNMVVRNYNVTAAGKVPLGTAKTSTGNVYFINSDLHNYIYGQATIYNAAGTGGIRNAYAWSGATINTANNLVNDNIGGASNFNTQCGRYKTFMAGAERQSYAELDNTTNVPVAPPFVNTGIAPNNLKLTNGNVSSAFNPSPVVSPLAITTDYFGTTRGATNVAAGAYETTGVLPAFISGTIAFDFAPINDSICGGNKPLDVTITPPASKPLPAYNAAKAPRLYYRRVYNNNSFAAGNIDANVIPALPLSTSNIAAGASGWRFVNAFSNTGNVYRFNLDLGLLKSTIATTPVYTIEYFVIAETNDGTVCSWSSGDFTANTIACPGSVQLENYTPIPVPADPTTATLDDNSVQDNYSIFRGDDLNRGIESVNNGVVATITGAAASASAGATTTGCIGDSLTVVAHYSVAATGDGAPGSMYRFQVATASNFTGVVQNFDQGDSTFTYAITTTTPQYIRANYLCSGTLLTNTYTDYITITGTTTPANTTSQADLNTCLNQAQNIVMATTTAASHQFWLESPKGKLFNGGLPPTTTNLSTTLSVTPGDTVFNGTWNTYVTASTSSILNKQGYRTATLDGSESGGGDTSSGIMLHVSNVIKLNSVTVKGTTGDGTASSGYKVSLYTPGGYQIYTSGAGSVADGATASIALTNWYIAPGDYLLLLDASTSGTQPTGALAFVNSDFPINVPANGNTAFSVTSGVTDFAIDGQTGAVSYNLSDNYYYFFDLDVNEYCTSPAQSFNWILNPSSCCSTTPVTIAGLVTTGNVSASLVSSTCKKTNGFYYYFDPANPNKLVAAINPNGNDWNPDDVVIDNSGAVGDVSHRSSDGNDSTEVMPYMMTIVHDGDLTVNGGVKVRMYYPNTDLHSIQSLQSAGANAYADSSWFKYEGTQADAVNALTPLGLTGGTKLVVTSTGVEDGINYVQFEGITNFSTFGYAAATSQILAVPLPLTLLDFNAALEGKRVSVEWQTTNEANIDHFEVEHSTDGRLFNVIDKVITLGSATLNSYKGYDEQPVTGNNYYRLKIVEASGKWSYSPTRLVNFGEGSIMAINLYPNPTNDDVMIKATSMIKSVSVFDIQGTRILSRFVNAAQYHLALGSLQTGVYYIQVAGVDGTIVTKSVTRL